MDVDLHELVQSLVTGLTALTAREDECELPQAIIEMAVNLAYQLEELDPGVLGRKVSLADATEVAKLLGMKTRGNAARRMRQGTKEDGFKTTYPALLSKGGDLLYDPRQFPFTPGSDPRRRRPAVMTHLTPPSERYTCRQP